MFCYKCGAQMKDGDVFCIVCGAKAEAFAQQPQQQSEQPQPQQPVNPAQPYGYSQGAGQTTSPAKKRSKKFLWIGIAAAAVLALAAVLVFVVFAGGGWPLSGNTTQTKFVNDSVRVFSDAFSGLGNGTMEKIMSEPFELGMDITANAQGQSQKASINAAYDNETFALKAQSSGSSSTLVLLGDILYMDSNGSVSGIDFESGAGLDKSMTLKQRLTALLQGIQGAADYANIDYRRLAEMFVNSINVDCFVKEESSTVLTLKTDDIVDMLKSFADKLDKDKALKKQLEDQIEKTSGTRMDVADTLSMAASSLEMFKGFVDFSLVWEVKYEAGAPKALRISFEADENNTVELTFGYQDNGVGKDIELGVLLPGDGPAVEGELSYKKTGKGVEYNGSLTASGETFSFEGSEQWTGEKAHGKIELSVPYSGEISIEYDETLKFGSPGSVKDDEKFKLGTSSASIIKISDLFGFSGMVPGFGPQTFMPPFEPSQSEQPAATQDTATYSIGVVISSGDDMRFSGISAALEDEIEYRKGNLHIMNSNGDVSWEVEQANLLLAQGCDAIIVAPVLYDNISVIAKAAGDAGVFALFINDYTDGDVYAVSRDYKTAGAYVADSCAGNVCMISSMEGIDLSMELEAGFNENASNLNVLSKDYADFDAEKAKTLTNDMLSNYDADTFVCLDPVVAPSVLEALNTAGFKGVFVCFTDEGVVKDMRDMVSNVNTMYIGFPSADAAYAAIDEVYRALGGEEIPKEYFLTPRIL